MQGPTECWALCNCTCHISMKSALAKQIGGKLGRKWELHRPGLEGKMTCSKSWKKLPRAGISNIRWREVRCEVAGETDKNAQKSLKSQRNIDKNMKRCSTSLVIMKMHTKTPYYFMPSGMAINKKTGNNKHWIGSGENGTLVHMW